MFGWHIVGSKVTCSQRSGLLMAVVCFSILAQLGSTCHPPMNQRRHSSSGLLLLAGIILALVSTLAAYGAEIGSPPELRFQEWPDSRLPERPAALAGRSAPTALDPSIWISPPALDGATDEPRNGALEVVQRRDAYAVRRYRQGFFQRFRFSGEWIDRAGKEGLGISNLDTALTLAIPLGSFENLLLVTPAFGVDYLAGPTDVDVPPRLYNTGVDLMWRKQFNDRWGSMVAVRPAVASDFRTGWDAIRVTGRVLATWQWVPERLSLLFGVVYLDRNDIPMLPGAGLIWTPNPDWRLDLIFPRPRLARRLVFVPHQREDWVYLGGSLGGRTWAVKRQSGVADQLTLRDYRLYFGWERILEGGSGLFAELGYVFGRKLEYEAPSVTQSLGDSVMLRGGISY